MDWELIGGIDISIKKASPSRAFDIATKNLRELAQPGEDFYGDTRASNDGKVMIFAGRRSARKRGQKSSEPSA